MQDIWYATPVKGPLDPEGSRPKGWQPWSMLCPSNHYFEDLGMGKLFISFVISYLCPFLFWVSGFFFLLISHQFINIFIILRGLIIFSYLVFLLFINFILLSMFFLDIWKSQLFTQSNASIYFFSDSFSHFVVRHSFCTQRLLNI